MNENPFDKILKGMGKMRDRLDPRPEGAEAWIPAKGDIVRLKPGTELNRLALRRVGIELDANKYYQVKDYKKTEDAYLLSLDEVSVQYIAGERIVAVHKQLQDPISNDLLEIASEHQA